MPPLHPPPSWHPPTHLPARGSHSRTPPARGRLYLAVVVTFQLLTDTMRVKEEFYLDKHIADTFIDNPFNELIT